MANERLAPVEEEIVTLPPEGREEITPLERKDIIGLAAEAENRVEAIRKIIAIALRVTNPFDWVRQGYGEKSKPYLCASGAEKIANLFRVRIYDVRAEKIAGHDDKGEYYFYAYACKASLPDGHTIETEGTCSSRDQFFSIEGKDAEGKPIYKPFSEIDETNIRKAAHSNMTVRAITQLLGLRNLSWEQLQIAGIDISKMGMVEYKGKTNGGGENKSELYISDAQRNRLFAIQRSSKVTEAVIQDYLKEKLGITTTREIKRKDYDAIISWIESGGKDK